MADNTLNVSEELVTVIIPVYNSESFIIETINSVCNQTHSHLEIIIVDDCSTDNSLNLIQEFIKDKRIRMFSSEMNSGGPAHPRNIGLHHALGEFICFLDSDDVMLPDRISSQIALFKKTPHLSCLHHEAFVIDENSQEIRPYFSGYIRRQLLSIIPFHWIVNIANPININTSMLRRDRIVHKFRECRKFSAVEDWFFWIENSDNFKTVKYTKERLTQYRVHHLSISQRDNYSQYRKGYNGIKTLIREGQISSNWLVVQILAFALRFGLKFIKAKLSISFNN